MPFLLTYFTLFLIKVHLTFNIIFVSGIQPTDFYIPYKVITMISLVTHLSLSKVIAMSLTIFPEPFIMLHFIILHYIPRIYVS